jgi:hypothetical protein
MATGIEEILKNHQLLDTSGGNQLDVYGTPS